MAEILPIRRKTLFNQHIRINLSLITIEYTSRHTISYGNVVSSIAKITIADEGRCKFRPGLYSAPASFLRSMTLDLGLNGLNYPRNHQD